jgi:hypothetical protein
MPLLHIEIKRSWKLRRKFYDKNAIRSANNGCASRCVVDEWHKL